MEYIYAVMLLSKAGKKVDEKSITDVLKAAGVKEDAAKAKSIVAALDGVDIEKVIEESSSVMAAAPVAASSSGAAPADAAPAKEEKKEAAAPAADAAAGLGSLF